MTRRPHKNQETARDLQAPARDFAAMADRLNRAAVLFAAVADQARSLAANANAEAGRLSISPPLAPADIEDVAHHVADAAKELVEHAVQAIKPIATASDTVVPRKETEAIKFANLSITELFSIIKNEFTAGADIKEEFGEATLAHIKTVLERLAKAEDIDILDKLRFAEEIHDLSFDFEAAVTPKLPDIAPRLWNDFKDQYGHDPYRFAHDVYGEAAQVAMMPDFRRLDPPLVSAMYKYRARKGNPPVELDIARKYDKPKRSDAPSKIITWADIMADAPEHTRALMRAYNAQRARLRRSPA